MWRSTQETSDCHCLFSASVLMPVMIAQSEEPMGFHSLTRYFDIDRDLPASACLTYGRRVTPDGQSPILPFEIVAKRA
ncbi:hypothetical protein WN51_04613 [Melipona quadrifasciata]|uniref:Uncharacterized protein n=1 Tax=Melipona quadrifasciata TaxID=166423 RepID=A0A0M8ZU86_9HYME|nr:hypothetical protein WN51_04613 [Melipona quadrifasciata]